MVSQLFSPLSLRGVTFPNRVVIAPMTQFSAEDGVVGDWHLVHLGQYAASGAALVLTESCYVAPDGRHTPKCMSLYTDEQEKAIGRIAGFLTAHGNGFFGVQLCHAGRKASAKHPWEGGGTRSIQEGGYPTVGPSAVPLSPTWPAPHALETGEIQTLVDDYAAAAQRASNLGADVIELHGAHGYLLHQFMSPISNHRTDRYGGDIANRIRFPMEVFEAVRGIFPTDRPIGMRLSATDWVPGGWDLESTIRISRELAALGCDYVHISSGGLSPDQEIVDGPGYQVGFAAEVKRAVDIAVIAVGQISDPRQAETILRAGQADMIGLARPVMFNPRWVWQAALDLGEETFYPRQYIRGHPSRWGARGAAIVGNHTYENRPRGGKS